MADLERTYNVPLRKEFRKGPRYKRAKRATTALRQFLMKHMKSETVLLGNEVNHALWEKGIKNPPHHIQVTAIKDAEGVVRAELEGIGFKSMVQKDKREEDTSLMGRLKSKMGVDEAAEEAEEKKAEKKEAKDLKKEAKKEAPKEAKPKDEPKPKAEVKTEPKKEAKPKAEKQAKLPEKAKTEPEKAE